MKFIRFFTLFAIVALCVPHRATGAAGFQISSTSPAGLLTWTNAFTNGICTIETASKPTGPWQPQQNYFTTGLVGQGSVTLTTSNHFHRLLAADISTNAPLAFSNLVHSYGVLRTIAGNGFGAVDVTNYWHASFEGGFATNAALSRPHFAMADNAGNIFIVDKDSHSVLKVTTNGHIHTVAGTHLAGDGSDSATPGTNVALLFPNGLWVRGDGTVYVLDTGNGKVRRLDTNGTMTTLFTVSTGISTGRGLWVKDDESIVYFCSGTDLRKRVPGTVSTLNNNFTELGEIVVNAKGDVVAADRGDHKVYVVTTSGGGTGTRTRIAGNGNTNMFIEGTSALTNGLNGVRGVWDLPNGGYLLALHEGSKICYVDPAGLVRTFLDGLPGANHSGDGQWFYSAGKKIAEARSVTMDSRGNIIIVENDAGFVRMIDFQRLTP